MEMHIVDNYIYDDVRLRVLLLKHGHRVLTYKRIGQVNLRKMESCKFLSSPFVDIFIYPYITTVWWLSVILLL